MLVWYRRRERERVILIMNEAERVKEIANVREGMSKKGFLHFLQNGVLFCSFLNKINYYVVFRCRYIFFIFR